MGEQRSNSIDRRAFPSVDARQEWKQVAEPHDADYEGDNLVGATGWAPHPDFSGGDVPFTHPFGFDWEFMVALDEPVDDHTKYSFTYPEPFDRT